MCGKEVCATWTLTLGVGEMKDGCEDGDGVDFIAFGGGRRKLDTRDLKLAKPNFFLLLWLWFARQWELHKCRI